MRNYTDSATLNSCKCPKPSAKLTRKWNRRLKAYEREIAMLEHRFFPEPKVPEPTSYAGGIWDDLWMFGYEVTDHQLESLTGFWKDPQSGNSHSEYWVPSEKELTIELRSISIDHPPSEDVAWDAAPVHRTGELVIR